MQVDRSKISQKFSLDRIDSTWNEFFFVVFGAEKITDLLQKIEEEYRKGACYPLEENVFRLFKEIPLNNIKAVILGQDPYHQPGIADGLAFSTDKQNFIPASLRNILRELKNDIGYEEEAKNGSLKNWVGQGVFLLNTCLTVRQSQQLSHSVIWKEFIHELIKYIDEQRKNVVWVFWGKEAKLLRDKCGIQPSLSITSSHPSPFSACYGFFGSKPFSAINEKLEGVGVKTIVWDL